MNFVFAAVVRRHEWLRTAMRNELCFRCGHPLSWVARNCKTLRNDLCFRCGRPSPWVAGDCEAQRADPGANRGERADRCGAGLAAWFEWSDRCGGGLAESRPHARGLLRFASQSPATRSVGQGGIKRGGCHIQSVVLVSVVRRHGWLGTGPLWGQTPVPVWVSGMTILAGGPLKTSALGSAPRCASQSPVIPERR